VYTQKWLFCPVSASGLDYNPENTRCIAAVKNLAFFEFEQNFSCIDGYQN